MKKDRESSSNTSKKVFHFILPESEREALTGDFREMYEELTQEKGRVIARLWYLFQSILLLKHLIRDTLNWSRIMFLNYLKIALRNMRRHKVYSFINIFGLSLGMACCILILFWVYDEWSYNRFHQNLNEIYRVYEEQVFSSGQRSLTSSSHYPLARFVTDTCPEISKAVRFANRRRVVEYRENRSQESMGFADREFLEVFTFPLTKGDPLTAFSDPFSIIITEDFSRKYFGDEDPLGKVLKINPANPYDVKVTGVFKTIPRQTDLMFDALLPFTLINWPQEIDGVGWGGNPLNTYVMLEGTAPEEVGGKITSALQRIFPDDPGREFYMHLQPLSRIHLYNIRGGGMISYLFMLSIVSVFILLIACINFMNLSTARAANRAQEVAMRKVVGAKRLNLIRQFFGESLFFAFIAVAMALCLLFLFLPLFNKISGKQLTSGDVHHFSVYTGIFFIALITGLLAGSYPALLLSSFKPIKILRGTLLSGKKSSLLRKLLVVGQFSLSIFLIIGTVFIYRQLNFIRNKDLGYNKENIVVMGVSTKMRMNYESIKNELLQNSDIIDVSYASESPSYVGSSVSAVDWDGRMPDENINLNWQYVDFDYIETMEMEIIEGRSFSREYATDATSAYIVNEEAVRLMGLESPVSKRLSVFGNEGMIIGVVKNFHFQPLRNEIRPYVMAVKDKNWGFTIFIRVTPDNISGSIEHIRSVLNKFDAVVGFNYIFLDDLISSNYRSETTIGVSVGCFTIFAVIISCLGLLGLASFMTQQRIKEIGIRKTLGASSSNLVFMLSREFTKWVVISNIIAWPAAYFIMKRFFQSYAYKVDLNILVFILAGIAALVIAWLTVSYQAFRAARANPVKCLRYE